MVHHHHWTHNDRRFDPSPDHHLAFDHTWHGCRACMALCTGDGPTRAAASRDEPRYRCSTALAAYHTGCPSRRAAGPPRTTTRAARATQPRRWWLASQRARVPHHACTRAHRPQGELGGRLRSTRVVAESSSCSVLRPRSSWSVCPWPASSLDPEFFGRNTCSPSRVPAPAVGGASAPLGRWGARRHWSRPSRSCLVVDGQRPLQRGE